MIEFTPPQLPSYSRPTCFPCSGITPSNRVVIHFDSDFRFEPEHGGIFESEEGSVTTPLNEPVTFTLVAEDGREFPRMTKSSYGKYLRLDANHIVKMADTSGYHSIGHVFTGDAVYLEDSPLPRGTRTTITVTPDHRIVCVTEPPKSAFPMTLGDVDGDEVEFSISAGRGYLILSTSGQIHLDDKTAPAFRDAIDTWIREREEAANAGN